MIVVMAVLAAEGNGGLVGYGLFGVLGSVLVYAVFMLTRTSDRQERQALMLVAEANAQRDQARAERDTARAELDELRERMQTDIDYWRERYLAAVQGGI